MAKLTPEQVKKLRASLKSNIFEGGIAYEGWLGLVQRLNPTQKRLANRLIQRVSMSIITSPDWPEDTVLPEQHDLLPTLLSEVEQAVKARGFKDKDKAVILRIATTLSEKRLSEASHVVDGDAPDAEVSVTDMTRKINEQHTFWNQHLAALHTDRQRQQARDMLDVIAEHFLAHELSLHIDELPIMVHYPPKGYPDLKGVEGNLLTPVLQGIINRVTKNELPKKASEWPSYYQKEAEGMLRTILTYIEFDKVERAKRPSAPPASPVAAHRAARFELAPAPASSGFTDGKIASSLEKFWQKVEREREDSAWHRMVVAKLASPELEDKAREGFTKLCISAGKRGGENQLLANHVKLLPTILEAFQEKLAEATYDVRLFNADRCYSQFIWKKINLHRKVSYLNAHRAKFDVEMVPQKIVRQTFADKVIEQFRKSSYLAELGEKVAADKVESLQALIELMLNHYAADPQKPVNALNRERTYIQALIATAVEDVKRADFDIAAVDPKAWHEAFTSIKVDGERISAKSILNPLRKKGVRRILNSEYWQQLLQAEGITDKAAKRFASRVLYTLSKHLAAPPLITDLSREDEERMIKPMLNAIAKGAKGADFDGDLQEQAQAIAARLVAPIVSERARQQAENQRRADARALPAPRSVKLPNDLFLFSHRALLEAEHFSDAMIPNCQAYPHGIVNIAPFDIGATSVDKFLTESHIATQFADGEVNHIFYPVGDGVHWRGVHIDLTEYRKNPENNKIQFNIFDSYGPGSGRAIAASMTSLMAKSGFKASQFDVNLLKLDGMTQRQTDGVTCGYYVLSYFHWQVEQLEAQRVPVPTRDDAYLPPYDAEVTQVFSNGGLTGFTARQDAIREILRRKSRAIFVSQKSEEQAQAFEQSLPSRHRAPSAAKPSGLLKLGGGTLKRQSDLTTRELNPFVTELKKAIDELNKRMVSSPLRKAVRAMTRLAEKITAEIASLSTMSGSAKSMQQKLAGIKLDLETFSNAHVNASQISWKKGHKAFIQARNETLPALEKQYQTMVENMLKLELRIEQKLAAEKTSDQPQTHSPQLPLTYAQRFLKIAGHEPTLFDDMEPLSAVDERRFEAIRKAFQSHAETISSDINAFFATQAFRERSAEKHREMRKAINAIDVQTTLNVINAQRAKVGTAPALSLEQLTSAEQAQVESAIFKAALSPERKRLVLEAFDNPESALYKAINMKRSSFFGYCLTLFSGRGTLVDGDSATLTAMKKADEALKSAKPVVAEIELTSTVQM